MGGSADIVPIGKLRLWDLQELPWNSIPGRRSRRCKGPEVLKDNSHDWGKEKRRRWMRPGRQAGLYGSGWGL